jgi:hypothetical protein
VVCNNALKFGDDLLAARRAGCCAFVVSQGDVRITASGQDAGGSHQVEKKQNYDVTHK